MAKLLGGILSRASGSLGNVVFSSWNGIPVVREKPTAYSSNSPEQQAQREKFGIISYFASILPPDLFLRFWKYWNMTKTPRNNWISETFRIGFPAVEPQYFFTTRGKLEPPYPWANSQYDPVTGKLHIKSAGKVYSTGELSDNIYLAIFWADPIPVIFWSNDIWTRAKAFWNVQLPTSLDPSYIGVYWTAYRGEGSSIEISNSVFQTVIAV